MSSSRRSIPLRRIVALVLMPVVTARCTSWQATAVEPRAVIESEHPEKVRITTQSDSQYVLHDPRIVTDTLVGRSGYDSAAVALRDVTRLDVRRFSLLKTAIVVLTVGGVALVIGGLYSMAIGVSKN